MDDRCPEIRETPGARVDLELFLGNTRAALQANLVRQRHVVQRTSAEFSREDASLVARVEVTRVSPEPRVEYARFVVVALQRRHFDDVYVVSATQMFAADVGPSGGHDEPTGGREIPR